MRLHRFHITESIDTKKIVINNEDLVHQWRNVFRYTTGAQVIVFNGDGQDYFCIITELYNRTATLEIFDQQRSILPQQQITLAMALVKKDTFEWIVEKATELGVSTIIPLIAERSEKKSLRMNRLEKIAIEASEQSGRGDVPIITEPMLISDFLASDAVKNVDEKIFFHTTTNMGVSSPLKKDCILCVGPEGGWGENEVTLFTQHNFKQLSLGKLVLRAETAAIAALSLSLSMSD